MRRLQLFYQCDQLPPVLQYNIYFRNVYSLCLLFVISPDYKENWLSRVYSTFEVEVETVGVLRNCCSKRAAKRCVIPPNTRLPRFWASGS